MSSRDPSESHPGFDDNDIQLKRVFRIHVNNIYLWIKQYPKGIHHTLEIYRGKRDSDGSNFSGKKLSIRRK